MERIIMILISHNKSLNLSIALLRSHKEKNSEWWSMSISFLRNEALNFLADFSSKGKKFFSHGDNKWWHPEPLLMVKEEERWDMIMLSTFYYKINGSWSLSVLDPNSSLCSTLLTSWFRFKESGENISLYGMMTDLNEIIHRKNLLKAW